MMGGIYMTEQQYKRASGAVFPVVMVILGYIVISMVMWAGTGSATFRTWIQLAAAVTGMIVSTIVFVTGKETKRCGVVMMSCYAIVYAVVSLVGTSVNTWTYAFPILFASIAFLNIRLIIGGNTVTITVTLIRLIMSFMSPDRVGLSDLVLGLIILILVAFGSARVVTLLIRFNGENMDNIREAAKKQEESNKKMALVAENIAQHFDNAMSMLDNLNTSLEISNSAMSNIVDATESTADAIQNQAVMCTDIQDNMDKAEEGTKRMLEVSQSTGEVVSEGSRVVRELKEQSEQVEKESGTTVRVIENLTAKVGEVQSFVGSILSISNQTNLLALNASIEAARAGEAGKGFAVVAEEIRQLSEQTKAASNNITHIIGELNEDTKQANESIEISVASVSKQNRMIEDTREKFERVSEEVSELADNIRNVEGIIEGILASTTTISDNISQLSATSEEVAASSTEGLKTFEATVNDMTNTRKILESIYILAQDLEQSI